MRILWVSPMLPYPPNNGFKVRIFNLMKPLSKDHEITFFSFADGLKEAEKFGKILEDFCVKVCLFPYNVDNCGTESIFSLSPQAIIGRYNVGMETAIKEEVSRVKFDAIIIEHLYMTQYLPKDFKGVAVFSAHDVESMRYKSTSLVKKGLRKRLWRFIEFLKLVRYEKKATEAFDLCITVSERDREVFEAWSRFAGIEEIPIGMDLSEFKPVTRLDKGEKILSFCGALNYAPNADAVRYFYQKVFPHIRKNVADIKLVIIGRNPTDDIIELERDDRVIVTGYVDDVKPYLQRSTVFVAPIRIGGGSKVKIIQAMACGLPVVTTEEGARGIHARGGEDFIVAKSSDEFAAEVIRLLGSAELRAKFGHNARRCVLKRYDIENVGERFSKILSEMASNIC